MAGGFKKKRNSAGKSMIVSPFFCFPFNLLLLVVLSEPGAIEFEVVDNPPRNSLAFPVNFEKNKNHCFRNE